MKSKLRGHHLICLNFFKGEGYTRDFIDNLYDVLKNDTVEIVTGPDDVCVKCPHLKDNKCENGEYSEEIIQAQDREALRLLNFKPGESVEWSTIASLISDVLNEWDTQYCITCKYRKICFT